MSDYLDELTKKYKEYPNEANADAWAMQDASNLQAVAQRFLCMTRAANFKYDNPAVVVTLDKMMQLCNMQGSFYCKEQDKIFDEACSICLTAFEQRENKQRKTLPKTDPVCPYCRQLLDWEQFKEVWVCHTHGKFSELPEESYGC